MRALALPSGGDAGDQLRRNQRVVICVYFAGAAEPVVARQLVAVVEGCGAEGGKRRVREDSAKITQHYLICALMQMLRTNDQGIHPLFQEMLLSALLDF